MCELEHDESVGVWSKERSEIMSQMTKKKRGIDHWSAAAPATLFFLHVVFKYCAQQRVKIDPLSGYSSYVKAVSKHRVRDKWKTFRKKRATREPHRHDRNNEGLDLFLQGVQVTVSTTRLPKFRLGILSCLHSRMTGVCTANRELISLRTLGMPLLVVCWFLVN